MHMSNSKFEDLKNYIINKNESKKLYNRNYILIIESFREMTRE